MLEVEVKYRTPDPDALLARLFALGGTLTEERGEVDHYLAAPDRDFADTDEAFRLRRMGERAVLTYKGPRRPGPVKARPELEATLAMHQADAMLAEQTAFRYREVAVVRTRRRLFDLTHQGRPIHASLDHLLGVGHFLEVEVVAEEADFADAQSRVLALAADLGVTDVETRSYMSLSRAAGVWP